MLQRTITLEVNGVPEMLASLRREMANSLRRVAAGQPAPVARTLNDIAAAYEVGQSSEVGQ